MTKFAALIKPEQYASQIDVAFAKATLSFQKAVTAVNQRQTADAASFKAMVVTSTETDKWTMYCREREHSIECSIEIRWLVVGRCTPEQRKIGVSPESYCLELGSADKYQ